MNHQDLDRLWADVPVGAPDLGAAVRRGSRARRARQGFGAVAATAVLVAGSVAGSSLWPRPDATPSPAPAVPSVVEKGAEGTATVYYLLAEPRFGSPSLLTSRTIAVEDTGSPGYDALHALLASEPPRGLTEGFNFAVADRSDPVVDVESVTHRDGVVEVDLTGRTHDPYPTLDLCCIPESSAVVQQLVLTVQAALDTDDPVRFNKHSIWFDPVPALVEADPDIVVPPAGSSTVEEVALPTGPTGSGEEELVGTLDLDADGCVVVQVGRPWVRLLLPTGWSAWRVEGELVLLEPDGTLAARQGQSVRIEYGYGKVDRGPCGGPDQIRVGLLSIR
jgi:hypothetical protein